MLNIEIKYKGKGFSIKSEKEVSKEHIKVIFSDILEAMEKIDKEN